MRLGSIADSLTARLAALAALAVSIGLLAAWLQTSRLVERQIERTFTTRVSALLDAVVAAAAVDPTGQPFLSRPVSEPRFAQPFSGAYWQIEAPSGKFATSRSLWDERLPTLVTREGRASVGNAEGPLGQHLRVLARSIVLAEGGIRLRVEVAVARDAMTAEIAQIRRRLALSFGLLGVVLLGAVVATVTLGLRPLRRLRVALADLRAGRRADLALAVPSEVRPLVAEIRALITQNRATVERTRNHVGNLAHALRTRLAVTRNALEEGRGADIALALRELGDAEHLVQHHLARARAAALAGSTAMNVGLGALAEEVARALSRLFADRGVRIEVRIAPSIIVRCERQDLVEMLGNLMENACQWATRVVRVSAAGTDGTVRILIEDDGHGVEAELLEAAKARGTRLDEGGAGSGLGLSITADLAALYGGELRLTRSELGGLKAELNLPGTNATTRGRV